MKIEEEIIKAALIQMDIKWENVESNLKKLDNLIKTVPDDTGLIILPEMFSTGFTMNVNSLPRPIGKKSFEWMQTKAKQIDKIITGSILMEENGKYYNRMFWMKSDGSYEYYNKRHLFHMGGEHNVMTAGTERKIIHYKGMKIMLQICYDLRFPVWSKNRFDKKKDEYEYDVLIYIANWPESRKEAYLNLLKARAIENQSYVIWVNRVGKDGKNISHSGNTQLIDPAGKIISQTTENKEEILNIEITNKTVKNLRENFKVGLDWDEFIIKT